jgi:hypothetical protein
MAMKHHFDDDQTDDFIINVVPDLRKRIKLAAVLSNLSVQEYVEQMVPSETVALQARNGRINRAAVDNLLRYREEIKRTHPGQVIENSLEQLYQAREERTKELEQRW